MDDAEILLAARELLAHGNYSSVVAVCTDVLADHPDALSMRLLLVRALLALQDDDKARSELHQCLFISPTCTEAYRLLGELCLLHEDVKAARRCYQAIVQLDPRDHEARKHLARINSLNQPTAALEKLPAATAAVGCASPWQDTRVSRPRLALGSESDLPTSSTVNRASAFGEYLVRVGVLSPMQLQHALVHHRRSGLRIGAAAVDLGFASSPKVEWAALAYHGGADQA